MPPKVVNIRPVLIRPMTTADLAKDAARERTARRALNLLGIFQNEVDILVDNWRLAAIDIGQAYKDAADKFTGALGKQAQIEALKTQVIFSALTVAASGGLSWITAGLAFAEQYPSRKLLIEAAQGAASAGIGEGFSALGPMVFTQENQSVSIDPDKFKGEREKAIIEDQKKIKERFIAIGTEWNKKEPEDWDDFDEKKWNAMKADCLKDLSGLPGEKELQSVAEMTVLLERGMWAKWMPGLRGERWVVSRVAAVKVPDYKSVGSAIEERLDALGILKAAGTTISMFHAAESEDKKLIAWANGYEKAPESLLKPKPKTP